MKAVKSYNEKRPTHLNSDNNSSRFSEKTKPTKSYHEMRPLFMHTNNRKSNRFPQKENTAKSEDGILIDNRNNIIFPRASFSFSVINGQQEKEDTELNNNCQCEKNTSKFNIY